MTKAVLLAIVAEGLMTLMDALIKSATPRYPTLQIAFLRFAFGMAGATALALWARPGWPSREATITNGLRAALIVLVATTFFFALGHLPLADAIALSFISPVLTALMGALFLGERLDWRIGLALAAGFAGMLLIVGGGIGSAQMTREALIGAAAVLISAVGYAINIIVLRHRATRDPLPQIVFFQNFGPAILLAVPAYFVWTPVSTQDLGLFAIIGTLGVIAHTMLAYAFARMEAARLAPVAYVTLAWGVLFGYAFFGALPTLPTLAGAALIVLGTLATRPR
ncbi:MAG: DMT family transporter [Hyphomicrobiaceae bacterium]|jgi:S-adenosylmethionine uptake transporter